MTDCDNWRGKTTCTGMYIILVIMKIIFGSATVASTKSELVWTTS